MKISDLLDYVDEIMHNVFSVKTKLRWINQLEAEVQTEVLLLTAEGITQYTEDDFSAELLVPAPHDQIYQNYLMWQIALAQGEDRANNLAEQFNRVWYAYLRFAKETINPGAGIADKVRYYLTAYQIAVKLGYTGTETEWVKSLRGADGEPGAGLNIADQVATEADLPNGSGLEKGTGYLVGEDNEALLYIWNGKEWFYKQKLSGEGKQGEPGPAGDPGVYVSETEPTDPDAVVWINPAGEATPGGGGGGSVDLSAYALKTELPTRLGQLTDDASHRTVTDLEKTAWNNKSNFSGAYADLTGKPTIPSKTSQLTNDSGYLTEHQSLAEYAKKEEIPTELAELTEDAEHRTVTDAEKEAWNAKSDFSGDFDDLTDKPLLCNINLLDNWDLASPVNQLGQTVYTESGYTIDRWESHSGVIVTVADTIELTSTNGWGSFNQTVPDVRCLRGQTVTVSIFGETTNTVGIRVYNGKRSGGTQLIQKRFYGIDGVASTAVMVPETAEMLTVCIFPDFETLSGGICKLKAAKLEPGGRQTLAHQYSDGKWVLTELPNYGDMLARCQRYQIRLSDLDTSAAHCVGIGIMESETLAQVVIPVPVTMRTNPVAKYEGLAVHDGTKEIDATNVVVDFANNVIRANLTITGGTAKQFCTLNVLANGYFILDANL